MLPLLRNIGESVVVLALVALVFAPLEDLRPVRSSVRLFSKQRLTDLLHALVTPIVAGLIITTTIAVLGATFRHLMPTSIHAIVATKVPTVVRGLLAIVLMELATYAVHYAMHRIPFLWRFHAIHHSSENLDFLAGMRRHPVDIALSASAAALPIFILGFSPATIVVYALFFRLWTIFVHSNIKIRLGRVLERIVASPFFHHAHHAKDERSPTNLASTLAIIDVLFGTYQERKDWPAEYGTDDRVAKSWIGQLLCRRD